MPDSRTFLRHHLLIPLLLFVFLAFLLESTNIDLFIADKIYQPEAGGWTLKNNYIVSELLHSQGQLLVKILAVFLFGVAILSQFLPGLKPYRKAIWYLALVMPLSGLLIGMSKEITHVDCPWDLVRYGGDNPYLRLFEPHPGDYKYGKCFPAGHAGAGFTFMALYFFLAAIRPAWKWYGLAVGVTLGLIFGITQQLRGAHFLSHDLWAVAVCWFNSLGWYWFFFIREKVTQQLPVTVEQ